jgi:hypothetical protein
MQFQWSISHTCQRATDQNVVLDATVIDAKLSLESGLKQVGGSFLVL